MNASTEALRKQTVENDVVYWASVLSAFYNNLLTRNVPVDIAQNLLYIYFQEELAAHNGLLISEGLADGK